MFNIKNIKEEYLNKTNLLKYVNEYDIYAYYIGHFIVGSKMSSPFREDNNPSFAIFVGTNGDLIYNDFLIGSGNCIRFVTIMENCSYDEALSILNKRYNLQLIDFNKVTSKYNHQPIISNKTIHTKPEIWISIKVRDWQLYDKEYWFDRYEITGSTLQYFDVYAISKFWINQHCIIADKHAYAYREDTNVYKIYQPYLTTSNGKFWSNIKNKEIYQGHDQLPDRGEILLITSSKKDVMVLYECQFNSVAPHTEHQILSEELYYEYSNRFDVIIILYDNDNAGTTHANKMVDKYNLKSLVLPDSDTKDPSDFVEKYDKKTLKEWILTQL